VERKIIILLLLFIAYTGQAQTGESFRLFTDRDLYISGETLLVKLFAPSTERSGIVNVDLVNRQGKVITGLTKQIVDRQADGYIYLPDSLSSGCYLLRVATRSSTTLTIKELYISNRFTGLPLASSDLRPSGITPLVESPDQDFQVQGIESKYKTREKGKVTVHLPAELLNKIEGNLLVSVAEMIPDYTTSAFTLKAAPKKGQTIEAEGIIIEGIVTEKRSGLPFKNAVVNLSIPDSIPGFQYFITGEDGRFYFQIKNYFGKIPVVIQCYAREKAQLLKITLTDSEKMKSVMPDFSSRAFPPDLRKRVEENRDAVTFRKIFNQQEITLQPSPIVKNNGYPFYGVPNKTVDPQLFFDLPDFTEISRELLPGVKFRTYNRIPTLQVFSLPMQDYFNESPLLLIDGIPVRDLNLIRDMGTKDIDKIEVCQSERFYGDLRFPGVVALYTSKADYTRIPESEDLIKLSLDVIQPQATLNTLTVQPLSNPDLRQVLLWNPLTKPQQSLSLDFQASDIQGNFRLILRGKTKDGSIFYKEQNFEVQ